LENYFKPIVTPFELYLALTAPADGAPEWGTRFLTDFSRVLTLSPPPAAQPDDEEDVPHFSLVTGKLVYPQQSRPMRHITPKTEIAYEDGAERGSQDRVLVRRETDLAVRKDGSVVIAGVRSLAGEKLRARGWQGLDSSFGDGEGAEVEMGRDGVARGYHNPEEKDAR
jgi:diphthamide biosynthesis protein 2